MKHKKIWQFLKFNVSTNSSSDNDALIIMSTYEDSINIQLKYSNDICQIVKGRLQENIRDFKRYNTIADYTIDI